MVDPTVKHHMSKKSWTLITLVGVALVVAIAIMFFHWPKAPSSHEDAALPSLGAAASSAPSNAGRGTSTWETYQNENYGFTLKYPSGFNVETHSSTDSRYEIDLHFTTGTSSTVPLTLQVTDLTKYLPLTTTPKLPDYIQTFSRLEGYKEGTIDDKHAYEYLICGRAACSQEVIFIRSEKEYRFSIELGAYVPHGEPSEKVSKNSISFESAPSYIQQIIESLQFVPATP